MTSKYIQSSLSQNENLIYEAQHHIIGILSPIMWCGFFGIGFIIGKHHHIIDYFTASLAITDRRTVGKRGLLSTKTLDLILERISSVEIKQGLLGRIFNYGTIVIATDGYHKQEFHVIKDPVLFKKIFSDTIESRRK